MDAEIELDRSDIGEVVSAIYKVVSGPAGPRNWELERQIFHPAGRLIRTGGNPDGTSTIRIMTLDEYIQDVTAFFDKNDLYEVELARRVDLFGNVAHVWSVYEARQSLDDPEPPRRGVNSIQLYCDETGAWSVMNVVWNQDRPPG